MPMTERMRRTRLGRKCLTCRLWMTILLFAFAFSPVRCLLPQSAHAMEPAPSPPEHGKEAMSTVFDSILQRFGDILRIHEPAPLWDTWEAIRDDGTWGDIEYDSDRWALWPPHQHLLRLEAIAHALRHPGHPLHENPDARAALERALVWWLTHAPVSPNWWHNEIGVPNSLAVIAAHLHPELSDERRERFIAIMDRTGEELRRGASGLHTGQNLIWRAKANLFKAALKRDEALLQVARDAVAGEVYVAEAEGIQPDGSFHQHGPQFMTHSYGRSLTAEIAQLALLFDGTPLAFDDGTRRALALHVLGGQQWTTFRNAVDFTATGRELARPGAARSTTPLQHALSYLACLDDPRQAEYEAYARRLRTHDEDGAPVGNRHFWRSDAMVHRRPGWYLSVKYHSTRTARIESGNNENVKGWHLTDGATPIHTHGNEYADLFPLWDWKRVPGITAIQDDAFPLANWGRMGTAPLAGGVSDGEVGAAAYAHDRDGLLARKAWFFTPEGMLALGAGIAADAPEAVVTTLNQCQSPHPPSVIRDAGAGDGEAVSIPDGAHQLEAVSLVVHDGVAYRFPEAATVHVARERRTGSWSDINTDRKEEAFSDTVFTLSLDHGVRPDGAGYAYWVLPCPGVDAPSDAPALPVATILVNTADCQVVEFAGGTLAAVLYDPSAAAEAGFTRIRADQPCILLLRGGMLHATALGGEGGTLTVEVDGARHVLTLPTGTETGRTVPIPLSAAP